MTCERTRGGWAAAPRDCGTPHADVDLGECVVSTSKTTFLNRVYAALKKRYGRKKDGSSRPVLEEAIFAVLSEDSTEKRAGTVFRRFRTRYVDWNEVRVSSLRELEETMAGLPNAEHKGRAMKAMLEYVFSDQHELTLEFMKRAPLKKAARYLKRSEGLSDFVVACVTLLSLDGHAVPVDGQMLRVMQRLGLASEEVSVEELRGSLERLVAKNRAYAFWRLVIELAQDTCGPKTPQCSACALTTICPTARATQAAKAESKPTTAKGKRTRQRQAPRRAKSRK